MKHAKIAVITLFWEQNTQVYLLRYLKAVSNLKTQSNIKLQVYLFDNSKSPLLKKYIQKNNLKIPSHITILEKNLNGYAPANNYAANYVARTNPANYYLFLNPDTEPEPQMLMKLFKTISKDPNTFSVEAKQLPLPHPKYYTPDTLETSWNSGACVLVNAQKFHQLGGFDTTMFMYAEDVDLSWKAWETGMKCLIQPQAICIHHHFGYSKNGLFRQYWNVRNGMIMRVKHGNLQNIWVYIKTITTIIFHNLSRLNLRESYNLAKALIFGIVISSKYINIYDSQHNHMRPDFAQFYNLEYAKQ